jgi:hypothetical protein
MEKVFLNVTKPIFVDEARAVGTERLLEARRWLREGRHVCARYFLGEKGEYSIDLTLGRDVMSDDELKAVTESEPYGTAHWNPAEKCFYVKIPDEICTLAGGEEA